VYPASESVEKCAYLSTISIFFQPPIFCSISSGHPDYTTRFYSTYAPSVSSTPRPDCSASANAVTVICANYWSMAPNRLFGLPTGNRIGGARRVCEQEAERGCNVEAMALANSEYAHGMGVTDETRTLSLSHSYVVKRIKRLQGW
jgi:hypothetical protein